MDQDQDQDQDVKKMENAVRDLEERFQESEMKANSWEQVANMTDAMQEEQKAEFARALAQR